MAGRPNSGTLETVSGGASINEPRVDLFQLLVTEAQSRQGARPEILEEDVGVTDEFLDEFGATVCLEINADTALVAVGRLEHGALAAGEFEVPGGDRDQVARAVGAVGISRF